MKRKNKHHNKNSVSLSYGVLFSLITLMIVIKVIDLEIGFQKIFPGRIVIFPWIDIGIVTVMGSVGILFYFWAGLPGFLNNTFRTSKGLIFPSLTGIMFGLVFVGYDFVVRIDSMSVGWPTSVPFYVWEVIRSEVIFRLFLLSIPLWFIGTLLLKKRVQSGVFWIIAVILSSMATATMLSVFVTPGIPLNSPGEGLVVLFGLLVFTSELWAFGLVKQYGFLSSVLFRLGFYSIWNIIWPLIRY